MTQNINTDVIDIGGQRVFLSTVEPTELDWRITGIVALISASFFAALVPFAKFQLPIVPAFIPTYESALFICDLITASLLFGQFTLLRMRSLLILAGGYLFSGLMAVPHALTFPGVFSPTGLLGAGPQTTAWLYISWHMIFPIIVIIYGGFNPKRLLEKYTPRTAVIAMTVAMAFLTFIITYISVAWEPYLPPILNAQLHYTGTAQYSLAFTGIFSLGSLIVLFVKRPCTMLNLWMMVVMCAWIFDVGLSAVFNNGRYDVGFYAGRIYILLGASFVLFVILSETTRLYARLADAARRVTGYAEVLEAGMKTRTAELQRTSDALYQSQKMEAIGNLTGGMAHDFNNMLGVIIGSLDTALMTADDETGELIEDAIAAAVNASELTKRLLAFARQQPLRPERVNINDWLENFVELLRRTLGENIKITVDLGDNVWPIIADKAQLESSITNLATNARDAMPNGGTLLIATDNRYLDADYAKLHVECVPGDYVVIEVTDSGTGMPASVVSHIFEPFYTTKEVGKGTGLGLSMVFGFIKQSKGHLSVYSEPGIGTTFRLYFPRVEGDNEKAALANKIENIPRGSGETILVAEDNDRFRGVVVRQLTNIGYKVIECNSGDAAFTILDSADQKIDLLFTDIVMPGSIDGIELAKHTAEKWPGVKILMTSGFPGGPNFDERLGGLKVKLLSKPYRVAELAIAMRLMLDRRKRPR